MSTSGGLRAILLGGVADALLGDERDAIARLASTLPLERSGGVECPLDGAGGASLCLRLPASRVPEAASCEAIDHLWHEHDAAAPGAAPSVFARLSSSYGLRAVAGVAPQADARLAQTARAVSDIVRVFGAQPPEHALLERLALCQPARSRIAYVGVMLARDDRVRLCLEHVPLIELRAFLVTLGLWSQRASARLNAATAALRNVTPEATVDLDVHPGGFGATVGVELRPRDRHSAPAWRDVLAALTAVGACSAADAESIRAWPGSGIVDDGVGHARRFTRYISHVKLAYRDAGAAPITKAYLAYRIGAGSGSSHSPKRSRQ